MRLDRPILRLDDHDVTLGEGVLLARLAKLDRAVVDRLATRIACAALAAVEEIEVGDEERQTRFDEWRREAGLLAADDFTGLLEAWGLVLDDVLAHLDRGLLAESLAERVQEARADHEPSPDEVAELLPGELLLEGALVPLLTPLAFRLVVEPPEGALEPEASQAVLTEAGLAGEGALESLAETWQVDAARATWLLGLEVAYRQSLQWLLSPERLERAMRMHRSDLAVLEVLVVEANDLDVASELALCVSVDRERLDDVAHRARLACTHERVLFKDLATTALGLRAAGARTTEAVGPVEHADGFAVGQVVARHEPSLDQPMVAAFLQDRLIQRELGRRVAGRVRAAPVEETTR